MVNLQDYIVESKLFKTFKVGDLLVVEYKCLVEDHQSDIWAHNNYFAYVLGGEKKWKTPANECKVGAGEALFVRKGVNTVYQYFDQPFFVIFIFISDDFIRKILSRYPKLVSGSSNNYTVDDTLIPLTCNEILESFFQSINIYFAHHVAPRDEILKLKVEELILNILSQPGNHLLKQYFGNLPRSNKVDIKEIMNANYSRLLSMNEYARLCGRSLASFRRDFTEAFGDTPGKWLLKKRLEHGRFLLETTTDRVNEIVFASGFKNRSHFNKTFRDAYGIAPNEYRQQCLVGG